MTKKSALSLSLEAKVKRLREVRLNAERSSVPSKRINKHARGKRPDWTERSLRGVPAGGIVGMIAAAKTGCKVIDERELPRRVAPPTTSFSYERGGFQRVD